MKRERFFGLSNRPTTGPNVSDGGNRFWLLPHYQKGLSGQGFPLFL